MKKITAFEAFSQAWNLFWKNPLQHLGVFLLINFVFFILVFILSMVNLFFRVLIGANQGIFGNVNRFGNDFGDLQLSVTSMILFIILIFVIEVIVQIVIYIGTLYLHGYVLDVVRNQYESLGKVFSRYIKVKTVLYYFVYSIIFSLTAFVLLIPLALVLLVVPTESMMISVLILWSLLMIYLAVRLMFVIFFLLDGYDFSDAIRLSWEKTKPYIGEILIMGILTILLAIAGLLAFIVGIFFAIPIVYLAYAYFYNEAVVHSTSLVEDNTPLEQ